MDFILEYDETDPISIEEYGKKLVGKTFAEVCEDDDITKAMVVREINNYEAKHENKKRKGGLGELIEERYFHYQANNDAKPDFDKAGVELKVTPYKVNKNGTISAKERLILTMIDYYSVVNETFVESHMWQKARLILLIYYLYRKEIENRLDYKIGYVKLFSPAEQDIKIIEHDFYVIKEKIKAGKAHELSESDTLYLGAAPKASSSRDRRKQPFSSELAKPRAFAFKNSYMTYVLNNYVIPGKITYEPIIKGMAEASFEDYVVEKINKYCGYTVRDLCEEFQVDFQNKIRENMSFPTFKFKELVEEEWDESTFGNYLRETRFLFVVYKYNGENELRLKGCQFWNIPYKDLEGDVKSVWEATKQVVLDGLEIKVRNGKHYNNFPKASDNPVCHVRPHARNAKDTYELPSGNS